ncbi:MAG: DUF2851 family protein [Bacteroidetes bacterium]|nr:MAG: DUF2851 family protein [Bacteroidota bacterium]
MFFPESFLHYVWQQRLMDVVGLRTHDGLPVQILAVGRLNQDQGPDFLEAKLLIGGVEWHGQVEIHIQSKDWYRHHHETDPGYNSVVLHVVWQGEGKAVRRQDSSLIPEVELKGRVPEGLLQRYESLQGADTEIPCAAMMRQVPDLHRLAWVERLAVERIQLKAGAIGLRMQAGLKDWEEVLWEEVLTLLGGPVNGEAFRELAGRIPYALLRKYRAQRSQMESLLFGAAGILGSPGPANDAHFTHLQEEWAFLKAKHQLPDFYPLPLKFSRMRPPGFPTLRLSQAAGLAEAFPSLIHLLGSLDYQAFMQAEIQADSYWDTHYRFGEESAFLPKKLGKDQRELLIINALTPIACLYRLAHGQEDIQDLIGQVLEKLSPESNRHTRPLSALGLPNEHALHSQGLIRLKKSFCNEKRCLSCGIGQQILKRG